MENLEMHAAAAASRRKRMSKVTNCHTAIGASLVTDGKTTGIYRKCPHCGMVDRQYSVQGANQAHHQITRVGALLKYECGRCRKQFRVIEICVPADMDPIVFYEKINSLLVADIQAANKIPTAKEAKP